MLLIIMRTNGIIFLIAHQSLKANYIIVIINFAIMATIIIKDSNIINLELHFNFLNYFIIDAYYFIIMVKLLISFMEFA